ncbi:ADP-ribosylglycohydrolase family protein [Candidatus Bathyarchaeota archaeon]|nr:ADP-ribosylglycohydrolase family protein [Candidatus Bathyarchaeota archaeon]
MHHSDSEFLDRVHGCLAGVAVGDAMGMPASSYLPQEIVERYGRIERLLDAPPGHPFHDGLKAGHITDDTELTMLVVEMLLEDGSATPEGMGRRILKWATDRKLLESGLIGPSTSRAIRGLMEGGDPRETGRQGVTNGAAMKISPIGIVNVGRRENLIDDVERTCLPSHGTSVAISAASAVAGAIAEALTPSSTVDSAIKASLECAALGARRGRQVTLPSIERRIELAIDLTEGMDPSEAAAVLYDYIGADVACVSSIPTVFGLFHAAGGDPMEAIIAASNMGGDTDTIASMVGGIAGAFKGVGAFPLGMVRQVEEESDLDLKDVALKLIEHSRR